MFNYSTVQKGRLNLISLDHLCPGALVDHHSSALCISHYVAHLVFIIVNNNTIVIIMSVVLMIIIIIIKNEIAIPTIIMMIMMTPQPAPQQSGKNPHRLYCTAPLPPAHHHCHCPHHRQRQHHHHRLIFHHCRCQGNYHQLLHCHCNHHHHHCQCHCHGDHLLTVLLCNVPTNIVNNLVAFFHQRILANLRFKHLIFNFVQKKSCLQFVPRQKSFPPLLRR